MLSDLSDKIKRVSSQQLLWQYYYMDAPHGRNKTYWEKATTRECYELFWTNPGSNTPQNNSLKATSKTILKTFRVRWTRHARHCWRSKKELIIDVLLWTPAHGRACIGRHARNYLHQLSADTRCCWEDLPDDRW